MGLAADFRFYEGAFFGGEAVEVIDEIVDFAVSGLDIMVDLLPHGVANVALGGEALVEVKHPAGKGDDLISEVCLTSGLSELDGYGSEKLPVGGTIFPSEWDTALPKEEVCKLAV